MTGGRKQCDMLDYIALIARLCAVIVGHSFCSVA
jgi:hypothetical protein